MCHALRQFYFRPSHETSNVRGQVCVRGQHLQNGLVRSHKAYPLKKKKVQLMTRADRRKYNHPYLAGNLHKVHERVTVAPRLQLAHRYGTWCLVSGLGSTSAAEPAPKKSTDYQPPHLRRAHYGMCPSTGADKRTSEANQDWSEHPKIQPWRRYRWLFMQG